MASPGNHVTWRAVAMAGGFVFLFVLIRCLYLDADTPRAFGKHDAHELFVEPPAKSHEARNWVLFGSFHLNPFDDYQFWRSQSPCWVYPLAGFWKLFGVGYPQLRIFSSLYSAIGFAVLLWLALRFCSTRAALLFGLFMLFDAVYVHYSRVGLLEPAVTTWTAVSILGVAYARERPAFLLLAMLGFVAAFFTKQAAVHAVPALLLGLAATQYRSPLERNYHRRWLVVTAVVGVALLSLSVAYMRGDAYARALEYNLKIHLEGLGPSQLRSGNMLTSLWLRLAEPTRYRQVFVSMPLTAPLALATTVGMGVVALRRRQLTLVHLLVAAWFLGAFGAVLVLWRTGVRFWTLAVPPAALMSAIGIDALAGLNFARARWFAPALCAAAACGQLAFHRAAFYDYARRPKYSVRDAARALEKDLGDRPAVIVGRAAPPVLLSTPYVNYYVRKSLNNSRERLRELKITHAFLSDRIDFTRTAMLRSYPRLLRGVKPGLAVRVRGNVHRLYDIEGRFGRPPKR